MADITKWSHSRLSTHDTCPRRYYHQYIAKDVKDEGGAAAAEGTRVHELIEHRLQSTLRRPGHEVDGVPLEPLGVSDAVVPAYTDKVLKLVWKKSKGPVKLKCEGELTFAVSKKHAFRGFIDLLVLPERVPNLAIVVDWKTGKVYPKPEQMARYALLVLANNPDIEHVLTLLAFIKHDTCIAKVYSRADLHALQQQLTWDIKRVLTDKRFEAKPSGLCGKYCPVHTCPHNGKFKEA